MTWRTLKPAKDLDFRCDLCGKPADTLHFVPWVGQTEKVVFACPTHDAGGYWVELARWFDPAQAFPQHIADKDGGLESVALLEARIEELRRL
jgi:hypothetical protein